MIKATTLNFIKSIKNLFLLIFTIVKINNFIILDRPHDMSAMATKWVVVVVLLYLPDKFYRHGFC